MDIDIHQTDSLPKFAGTNSLSRLLNVTQPRLARALDAAKAAPDALVVCGDRSNPLYALTRLGELAAILKGSASEIIS